MRPKQQAASRFLLPLEMSLGCQAIGIGIAGPLGGGVLFKMLQTSGQAGWWLLAFVLVGCAQLMVGALEWSVGRRWSLPKLYRMVAVRTYVALLSLILWCSGSAYLWLEAGTIVALSFILPVNALFTWWSYHENLKVKYALDEDTPTSTLVFHR